MFGVGYGFKGSWGVGQSEFELLTLGTLAVVVAFALIGYWYGRDVRSRTATIELPYGHLDRRRNRWRLNRQPPLVEGHIATGDKGLKADALGYMSNLVIGVASTAPAYSLAATLGFIVVIHGIGVKAPAVLIVSFVPILFVSLGYRYLNRADPDAGTTFAWTTRAFGPWLGWMNGWAIFVADVIVMASLSVIASQYTYLLFGWTPRFDVDVLADRRLGRLDRADDLDLLPRYRALGRNAGVPAQRRDRHPRGLLDRRARQGLPRQRAARIDACERLVVQPVRPLLQLAHPGVLLGIFIYWGWDSGVAVNEESRGLGRRARARPPCSRRSCSS